MLFVIFMYRICDCSQGVEEQPRRKVVDLVASVLHLSVKCMREFNFLWVSFITKGNA